MLEEWRDVDTKTRGRLGEIALRIAYITSAANHDPEVPPLENFIEED